MFLISLRVSESDNLMKRPWNDTFRFLTFSTTHHSMCLPTSCLSICKDGAVIAFEYIIDKGECSLLVDITLKRIDSKYTIETECFRWLLGISFKEFDLIDRWIDLYNSFTTLVKFKVPRYFYLVLIGLHLTMTLTASVI